MPYLIDKLQNTFSDITRSAITIGFDTWQTIYDYIVPDNGIYNKIKTDHSILLLHGFLGWGREELTGIKYWGGVERDIQNELINYGYKTVTVGVGPISSNWDRAIEAYYQLKGGVVDYGACHANEAGHQRFGFNYTKAILPEWDENHPVDIISHSLGGTTARMLIKLLVDGSDKEINCPLNEGVVGELFLGNKNWVTSSATISSPHQGSTITNCMIQNIDMVAEMFGLLSVISGKGKAAEDIYNFKLHQWTDLELTPKPHEDFESFEIRVIKSFLLNNTITDSAVGDLTEEGILRFTELTQLKQPEKYPIHYFSYSTEASHPSVYMPYDDKEVANMDLLIPFIPMSNCIGTYIDATYNNSWHQNDGVVNTISQAGPIGADIIHYHNQSFTHKTNPGVWNHCGVIEGFDHTDVIGFSTILNPLDHHDMGNFYYRLAGSLFGIGQPGNEYCPQVGGE